MFQSFKSYPFHRLVKLFIVLQPILDILTYFSITYLQLNVTIGILIRVLFMTVSIFYIFFGNEHRYKKMVTIYLFALFIAIGISFILNLFTKPYFHFFSEVQYVVKAVYFPTMFCAIMLMFSEQSKNTDRKKELLSAVTIAMTITALSLFTSIITNTSSNTYTYVKLGFTGWFFAGNELSAIVAVCFPLLFVYSITQTKAWKDFIYWIPTIFLAVCALLIGTKVSFLAILATIIIAVIFTFVYWLINLKNEKRRTIYQRTFIISLCLAIFYIVITPITPAYLNLTGDYQTINDALQAEVKEPDLSNEDVIQIENDQEKDPFLQSPLLKILLSSRNVYFEQVYTDYVHSSMWHKFFGLGYAGIYEHSPKLVEMDFFDLFFSFGIIGFLLLIVPIMIVFASMIKHLVTRVKTFFQPENILFIISIGLGLGVAFFAGHVLYAPAVSIYLAVASVLLIYNSQQKQ